MERKGRVEKTGKSSLEKHESAKSLTYVKSQSWKKREGKAEEMLEEIMAEHFRIGKRHQATDSRSSENPRQGE